MKRKEKWRAESMEGKMAASSDSEDSSDEKNYNCFAQTGGVSGEREEQERHQEEEEEEDGVEDDDIWDEDGGEEGNSEEASSGSEEEEDPEEGSGSRKMETQEDVKTELSNMSFEDVLKLRNKVGTKVYGQVAFGSKSPGTRKGKRLNKNRPMEISSKRPAPFLRQVVNVKKPMLRDPRFDDLSGEYKPEIFEKTYKFIDDLKSQEKQILKKQLKKTKGSQRKEQLHLLLKRMENQERAKKSREQQRESELQLKRQQRERAAQGARPFFFKKSEKKKLQLASKYQELKKSGKLENFLSKKRKRNAGKDRRKLPKQLHSSKDC